MEYDILKLLSQAPQTNMSVMQPSQELPLALMNAFPPEPGFPVSGAELVKISKSRGPASDAEGKLRAKQLESLEAQRAGIEQFNQKIAEQEGKGINPLVAGLMGASDLFSGTNNLAGLQQQKQAQENKSLQNQVLLQNMKRDLTDAEVELLKADAQKQKDMRQEELLRLKFGMQEDKLTPGQEAADRAFGKEYQDWTAQGGYANVDKQIAQIEAAANALDQDDTMTGGIQELYVPGGSSDFARSRSKPEAFALQQGVEQAIQASLRQTLGSQFTEKEGEKVIARAFDPRLPAKENAKKLRAEIKQLRSRAAEKEAASRYFEQHGTLRGHKPGSMSGEGSKKEWNGKTYILKGNKWIEETK